MLNLLRKTWRPSKSDINELSEELSTPEAQINLRQNIKKRGISPRGDQSDQAAKRVKLDHATDMTSDEEDETPPAAFAIPVFRFDTHSSSSTPVTSAEITEAIVRSAIERNEILAVEDGQAPMEIYIPVLQHSKLQKTGSQNSNQVSLVVTELTEHAATQARLISIASKSIGSRAHISFQVFVELTGDENDLQQGLNRAMQRDAIFLSPVVLDYLLSRGILSLAQVGTIVLLDDASCMREEHIVSKTLYRHYGSLEESKRPRLLSFICKRSSSTRYDGSLFFVEELLLSRIHGVPEAARRIQIRWLARPEDIFILHDAEITTKTSPLLVSLGSLANGLNREIAVAEYLRKDLGDAGVELFWKQYLQDTAEPSPTVKSAVSVARSFDSLTPETQAAVRKVMKDRPNPMIDMNRSSPEFNVTCKFLKLCQALAAFEVEGDTFRGIILVDGDTTATLLPLMLQLTSHEFLRVTSITSTGPNNDPNDTDNTRNTKTIEEFRSGTINLLITTNIGEDLLDLCPATCVIRWDVPRNFVSYCHSKARMDLKCSRFIILFEKGNDRHRRIADALRNIKPAWRKWIKRLNDDIRYAPPRDLLDEDVFGPADWSDVDGTIASHDCIVDAITGSKLTSSHALAAVYRFASAWTHANGATDTAIPLIECRRSDGAEPSFSCVINLARTPLGTIVGPWCRFRQDARRLACYQACRELHRLRLLEPAFFPPPPLLFISQRSTTPELKQDRAKSGPKGVGAQTPSSTHQSRTFTRREAKFWERSLQSPSIGRFYPTTVTISVDAPSELEDTPSINLWSGLFRSICILTRFPLPSLPPLPLHFPGQSCTAYFKRCAALDLTESEVHSVQRFSEEFCKTITARNFVIDSSCNLCTFVPLLSSFNEDHGPEDTQWPFASISRYISWGDVHRATITDESSLELKGKSLFELESLFEDAVLQEQRGFTSNLYYGIRMRPDLNPCSKIPGQGVQSDYPSLLKCHQVLWHDYPGITNESQALIEAFRIPRSLNLFKKSSPVAISKAQTARHYCIPEVTRVHPLSASILKTGAFCNRIEDSHLIQALTPNSALMEHNYQRLEFFGDSFLKHMSSIYVIVLDPQAQEEQLHLRRAAIVQNSTLQRAATAFGLPEYILSRPFSPKYWYPPGYSIKGRRKSQSIDRAESTDAGPIGQSVMVTYEAGDAPSTTIDDLTEESDPRYAIADPDGSTSHSLTPKRIADVVESVIGAAYLTGGDELGLMVCKTIGLPIPNISRWSDFTRKVVITSPGATYPIKQEHAEEIERIIGFKFSKPKLLQLALTHKTAALSHRETYERLEFLGDGVLDFLTVQYLYDKYPDQGPGKMTAMKNFLVSLTPLSVICVESGLGKYLIYGSPDLRRRIDEFEAALSAARTAAHQRAMQDGLGLRDYWHGLSAPK
ncbi:hypothetical protein FRB90_001977, partial [Tulasnella sp. 427]